MKLANLSLIVLSVTIPLGLMEAYLRFDDYSPTEVRYSDHEWNGNHHRVLVPHSRLNMPKDPVLVAGDSFVAGYKCGHKYNLTGHLEALILETGLEVDVLNFGRGSSSVFSYLSRLWDYLEEFDTITPSAIVIVLYSNDINIFEQEICRWTQHITNDAIGSIKDTVEVAKYCRKDGSPADSGRRFFTLRGTLDQELYKHSYLYRLLRAVGARLLALMDPDQLIGRLRFVEQWLDFEGGRFRLVEWALGRIQELADKQGVRLIVAWYPNVEDLSEEGTFYEVASNVTSRLSDRLGIPVYNGYEAFANDERAGRRMVWSVTDDHPNCLAHKIYADWLLNKLAPHLRSIRP